VPLYQTKKKTETPTFTPRIDFFPRVPLTRKNSYDFYALDDWKPYSSSPLCIVKGLIFRIILVYFCVFVVVVVVVVVRPLALTYIYLHI